MKFERKSNENDINSKSGDFAERALLPILKTTKR